MTTISKKNQADSKQSLAIISSTFKNKTEYALTKEQVDYITNDIKTNDKKFICINTLSRLVCVILVDDKKNHYSSLEGIRKNGAIISDTLNSEKRSSVSIINELANADYSLALAEGIALANYQFIKHKPSAKKNINVLNTVNVVDAKVTSQHVSNLSIAVDATLKARDLVNEPVNVLNATGLANAFKAMGKTAGFKVEVLNKAKIKQLKMGGLLAVNAGSVDEPTFSIMEYKPKKAKNKKN